MLNLLPGILMIALTMSATSDTLLELMKDTNFKLLTIQNHSFFIEIKEPYPFVLGRTVSKARIHYFDKSDQKLIFALDEHKASGYRDKRTETNVDLRSHTITTRIIEEDFKFIPRGKKVRINDIEAYFEPWANRETGGYLHWVQNGTYIEMESADLPEQIMIDLAKTVK